MLKYLLTDHDHLRKALNALESQFLELCRGRTSNYAFMLGIAVYIQEYPEQVHHPLEDAIYALLLKRGGDAGEIARNLIKDHTELEGITRTLRKSLELLIRGTTIEETNMTHQLSRFLIRQRQHLYAEEVQAYPLFNKFLTDRDWEKIGSDIPYMADPVFGERGGVKKFV